MNIKAEILIWETKIKAENLKRDKSPEWQEGFDVGCNLIYEHFMEMFKIIYEGFHDEGVDTGG